MRDGHSMSYSDKLVVASGDLPLDMMDDGWEISYLVLVGDYPRPWESPHQCKKTEETNLVPWKVLISQEFQTDTSPSQPTENPSLIDSSFINTDIVLQSLLRCGTF